MQLLRPTTTLDGYEGLAAYAGDLHNHCGISYGHGSIEDAYRNAQTQLDFASVTGHANWHDIPSEPDYVADYHRRGFEKLRAGWGHVQDVTESVHEDGRFVSLLSFEWHSMTYGDHCVYYKAGRGPLDAAGATSLDELRAELRRIAAGGLPTMMLPHHIGYLRGYRGINWSTFTEELSPVIELVSMHGNGEDDHAPRQYLHTMGPRDVNSMAFAGLRSGRHVGFIGSTDHHSAHPGSYGYGRAMVWASELTRDGIWNAIQQRRTYCVTGDRIMLAVALDGHPMGSIVDVTPGGPRRFDIAVRGGSSLDYVELVRNGEVVARTRPDGGRAASGFDGVVAFGMGWGETGVDTPWEVELEVEGGRLEAIEPRLHGYDTVDPVAPEPERYSFSSWEATGENALVLRTRTNGNPTVMTDATQRIALHLTGDGATRITARINGEQTVTHRIDELLGGPRVGFTGGFLSGSYVFERAEPASSTALEWSVEDAGSGAAEDWYYVRVRQHNEQYAWSSPIWARRSEVR